MEQNNIAHPSNLAGIQDQINKLGDMLKEEYFQLAEERKKFIAEKEKFDAAHKIVTNFQDPMKLNVGGQIFMTSKSTLLKEESMLSAMFSGRHQLNKGEDGAYFIDRDPKHFRKILNYLRDGEFEMHDNPIERKEIMREAEFYSLTTLIAFLASKPDLTFDLGRKAASVTINGGSATNLTSAWLPAFTTTTFRTGVHTCTFAAPRVQQGAFWLVGVAGANIDPNVGAYSQSKAIMLQSNGRLYSNCVAGKMLQTFAAAVTVELDCDNRTVTWIVGTTRSTEPLTADIQAPYSFCVDFNSTAEVVNLTALN